MLELEERNYCLEVEQAAEPVLIGIYGNRPLPEGFARLAEAAPKGLKCCRLNASSQPALAARLCAQWVQPSLLLVQEGQVAQRFRGEYDSERLCRILDLR